MEKYFVFACLILVSMSCSEPEPDPVFNPVNTPTNRIDDELEPYVDRFIEEANKRGYFPYKDKLTVLLVDDIGFGVEPNTYCGYGWNGFSGSDFDRVEIVDSDGCWHNRTDIQKEYLMFHELGHAYLNRSHYSLTFPNGTPKSLMCTGEEHYGCSTWYVYHDNEELRDYYIDELFDALSDVPEFVNRVDFKRNVYKEEDREFYSDWELYEFEYENDTSGFSFTNDTIANAVILKTTGSTNDYSYGYMLKRFNISDFNPCENLKLKLDINASGITNGYFAIGLHELKLNEQDSLEALMVNVLNFPQNGSFENYVHELYCLNEETNVISIALRLHSKTPAEVEFKNFSVDLYE